MVKVQKLKITKQSLPRRGCFILLAKSGLASYNLKMPFRNFLEQEYYHLYNHGIDDKLIFKELFDYKEFLFYLKELNDKTNVNIYNRKIAVKNNWNIKRGERLINILSYILLPNHFHIFFQAKNNADSSLFLQKLGTTFTRFFNKKYGRKGSLFLGKMKTKHINENRYLMYITHYIHLNALDLINKNWREGNFKLSLKYRDFLFSYPWSSLSFYTNKTQNNILDENLIKELFPNSDEYVKEIIAFAQSSLAKPDLASEL